MSRLQLAVFSGAVLMLLAAAAHAGVTITINNVDAPGVGFNDPTPVSPVGGNPGSTRGEQRLIAFQFAADLWGSILEGSIEVKVQASFGPLSCSANSATLGAAGPIQIVANEGALIPDTWYPIALANNITRVDQSTGLDDISATFNGDLDENNGCLNGIDWYYGLDNAAPGNDIDFLNTVMHEIAHGLGFVGFVDLETGALTSGLPDIYTLFTFDNQTLEHWDQMSNAERAASAINDERVVWDGPGAVALAADKLGGGVDGNGFPLLYAPDPLRVGSSIYHWDTGAAPNLLMEPFLSGDLESVIDVDITAAMFADIGWGLVDADADLVPDANDNCTLVANPGQRDTNGDGYGNDCDPDLNDDGSVNFIDLGLFKEVFLSADEDADFNGDGSVNFIDLSVLSGAFLGSPGPSGIVP